MKRTIIGKCLVATLCAFSFTGFAGSETTTATHETVKSNDQMTIEDLRDRVEKLELISAVLTTGYAADHFTKWIETMADVIILSQRGNRFADQWVKEQLAVSTNVSKQIDIAFMFSSNPTPSVRDKEKALHYAILAYSQTTNSSETPVTDDDQDSPSGAIKRLMPEQIKANALKRVQENQSKSLEALAAAYAINGDFKKAIEAEEKAISIAMTGTSDTAHDNLLASKKIRLELYKKGLPYVMDVRRYSIRNLSGLPQL